MSAPNDTWLQAALESFTEAVEAENWEFAQNIVDDVRDQGFAQNADTLQDELDDAKRNENYHGEDKLS